MEAAGTAPHVFRLEIEMDDDMIDRDIAGALRGAAGSVESGNLIPTDKPGYYKVGPIEGDVRTQGGRVVGRFWIEGRSPDSGA